MIVQTCIECGVEIDRKSTRCRPCYLKGADADGIVRQPEDRPGRVPEQLWTGAELLDRHWSPLKKRVRS